MDSCIGSVNTGFIVDNIDNCLSTIWYSQSMSSTEVISLPTPSRISLLLPRAPSRVMSAGMTKTSRLDSTASCAVISVPESSPASAINVPRDIPATISLRIGKLNGSAIIPTGNCETSAPPFATIFSKRAALDGG